MDVLEDKGGRLTFQQVSRPPVDHYFRPLGQDVPNLGISASAYWFRVRIFNASGSPAPMILQQFTSWVDRMDIYIVTGLSEVTHLSAGDMEPFNNRLVKSPHFLFPMALEPDGETYLFIRVADDEPLQLPFTLWRQDAFRGAAQQINLYFGLILGCLASVALYNLFLYFSLRDENYLLYVIYVASLCLMIATYAGYSYQYLWPNSPGFQNWVVFPAGHLAMFLALAFTKRFLNSRETMPAIHHFMAVFQALCVLFPLMGLAAGNRAFTNLTCVYMAMIFPLLQTAAGLTAYQRNVQAARFFILAWVSSIAGILYTLLSVAGYAAPGPVSRHAMEVGLVFDAVLLSFALADRIKILRMEKESAEARARELLAASKRELEGKVALRTDELLRAKERAEEATELKDRFVVMVAHDLRSPIGSLINMIKFLKLDDPDTPSMATNEEIVTRAIDSSERLLKLIDNLLSISRLNTGKVALAVMPLNAYSLANLHIASLEYLASKKGVAIRNELPMDFVVMADFDLFGEAVCNLLTNAIKFCHAGGVVTVFKPEGPENIIAVRDTGVGIEPEVIPKLFRHDTRVSRKGTAGESGTGLGLPYCHDIMAAHGGSVRAESQPGNGSVFYLELP
jgi:signal transduction histidine kinase